jgi:dTDP-glucose 4,6-dehydratase
MDNLTGSTDNVAHISDPRFLVGTTSPTTSGGRAADYVLHFASPPPDRLSELPTQTLKVGARHPQGAGLAKDRRAAPAASTSEVYGDPLVHPQREDY